MLVYCWSALIALPLSPFDSYAVASSRKPCGSCGWSLMCFCAFETGLPPRWKMFRPWKSWSSPPEPEPTPRNANVIAKSTARIT